MGCDIHCYVEYKIPSWNTWSSFGGRINPGRYYSLFSRLAGVRGSREPIVEPRGFPDDASYRANIDNWLFVCESSGEGFCSAEQAEKYVSYGSRYKDESKKFVSNPDWHTHSWLTREEYESAISGYDDAHEYRAILAAMKSLEADRNQTRIVFWFDN